MTSMRQDFNFVLDFWIFFHFVSSEISSHYPNIDRSPWLLRRSGRAMDRRIGFQSMVYGLYDFHSFFSYFSKEFLNFACIFWYFHSHKTNFSSSESY